jgi:2'-5' RNA ligase
MNQTSKPTRKVFFALWPTRDEYVKLAAWQNILQGQCGGRPMEGDTLHNTLVFIGEVDELVLEALALTAAEIELNGFDVFFDHAQFWRHNRIVFASPSRVPQNLTNLVDELRRGLEKHGFAFDRREYQPHVTLFRHARWGGSPLPRMEPVRWAVNDFALVESKQQSGRASYGVLARFPLRIS